MISGAIDGLAGADTIDIDMVTGPATITLTNAAADNATDTGGYDGIIPLVATNGFSNVTVIVGTGDGDELIGDDQAATWTLDGGIETYATDAGGDPDLTFSNVTDLTGGMAADTFIFDVDAAATVAGGAGDDSFNINVSLVTATLLGGDDSDTFTLADGVSMTNVIDGGGGGTDVDELVGAATLATTFTPTADGDGGTTVGAVSTYTDIENLTGRGGADSFDIGVAHTGDLAGGGGDDDFNFNPGGVLTGMVSGDGGDDIFDFNGGDVVGTVVGGGNTAIGDSLDFAGVAGPVVIDLGDFTTNADVALGSTDGFTGDLAGNDFSGIEDYVGTAATDTLSGTVNGDVFNVLADNAGTIIGSTATFTDFEILIGEDSADQFNISNTFSVSEVQGGLGRDLLNLSAYTTDLTFTLNVANGGGTLTAPAMTFAGIEDFSSGSGNDSYIVSDTTAIDLGTVPGSASIDGGTHTTFDQISFTSGSDTIVAIDNIPAIERLTSSGASDTLIGQVAAPDTFQTTSTDDGTVGVLNYTDIENLDGAGGPGIFNIDHDISGGVMGGDGADNFFITTSSVSIGGGIDGNAGDDTTTIGQSMAAADPADVSVMLTSDLAGGTGSDTFEFRLGSTLIGDIQGSDGNGTSIDDAIIATFSTSATTVVPSGTGTSGFGLMGDFELIFGTPTSEFDNIDTIIGNGMGTLFGDPVNPNTFVIFDVPGIAGTDDQGTLGGAIFNNFNLVGGNNNDLFRFQADGRITIGISGGAGGTDTVESPGGGSIFTVTGMTSGTIDPLGNAATAFSNIDILLGAGAVDTIIIPTIWGGSVNGGVGGAEVQFTAALAGQSIALTANGTNVGFQGATTTTALTGGFNNITTLTNLGAGTTTLRGANLANTWTLTDGDLTPATADNDGTVATATRSLSFAGFNHLIGGAFVDVFNIADEHTGDLTGGGDADRFVYTGMTVLTGSLFGDAGADVLDYSGYGGVVNVRISGSGSPDGFVGDENMAASLTAFDGINDIRAEIAGGDGLEAPDAPANNIWTITDPDIFTLDIGTGPVAFSNFSDLTGGTGNDSFIFNTATASVSGGINGGTGGTDILSFAGAPAAAVLLTGLGASNGFIGTVAGIIATTFNNINTLIGSANTDSLTGRDVDATWTLDGTDYSEVVSGRTLTFTGTGTNAVENLFGGSMVDTFDVNVDRSGDIDSGAGNDVINLSAVLSGSVALGDGDDTLNFIDAGMIVADGSADGSAETGVPPNDTIDWSASTENPVILTLTDITDPTSIDGSLSLVAGAISEFESFATNGASLLQGPDAPVTYTITGDDAFFIDLGAMPTFTGFSGIIGGTDVDTFVFFAGGDLATIDGGGATNIIVGVPGPGANTFSLDGAGGGSFTSSSAVTNSPPGDGTTAFTNITDYRGGLSATDIFTLTGAPSLALIIDGVGGAGDQLTGDGGGGTWALDAVLPTDGVYGGSVAFSNIANLVGGVGADVFQFTSASAFTSVTAGGGSDTFNYAVPGVTGPVSVNLSLGTATHAGAIANDFEILIGSADLGDTLTGANGLNTWNVAGPGTGTVSGLGFSAIENLTGGTGNDSFVFSTGTAFIAGAINGGAAGVDSLSFAGGPRGYGCVERRARHQQRPLGYRGGNHRYDFQQYQCTRRQRRRRLPDGPQREFNLGV